ncbi:hypothetical protein U2A4042520157 [Corynebacterium striatum]|nr:hypothetical protein U2A4042520157 [Corynebacterium striatum]
MALLGGLIARERDEPVEKTRGFPAVGRLCS